MRHPKKIDRRVLWSLLEVCAAQATVATRNIHDELYNEKSNRRGKKPSQSALDQCACGKNRGFSTTCLEGALTYMKRPEREGD